MSSQQTDHTYTNHLINENSPYLLQHAHNPVEWYPWDEEALSKAKSENKMMIISIGYAACHWCHVMEHESFEDDTVAAQMNELFINIKVDREERPDIDDVYMTACQLASGGRGCGWPLNAFALPDGRPVWAGTYFPKDQWMNVLKQFSDMWQNDKEKLLDYAEKLTSGIQQQDQIVMGAPQDLHLGDANTMAAALISKVDMDRGGRKGAPKFPMPTNYLYLLDYHLMTGSSDALKAVEVTLDHMANGGIYDQLGGGFARYSTDQDWIAPHFEKMMYDNGQLLSLYSKAYQVFNTPLYRKVIEETVEWLRREMTNEEGGFYSSLDADSEGVEGKFYVWSAAEIDSLLPEGDADVYKDYFTIKSHGNWEETNILFRDLAEAQILKKHALTSEELNRIIERSNKTLFQFRSDRIRPGLDDKVLTSWNSLMLTGLLDAYKATHESNFLDMALKNAAFLKKHMMKADGQLWRNFKDGQVKINAFLDDYAFLIEAFTNLYQVTFQPQWLNDAKKLTDYTLQHFFDDSTGFFNYTSDLDPPLVARKKELGDNVIPGSNSAMARNLNLLSHYFDQSEYGEISDALLSAFIGPILESGQTSFYSNWARLYLEKLHTTYEIAIVGSGYSKTLRKMQQSYLPNAIYMGGAEEGDLSLLQDKLQAGKTMIYVCQNKVCQLPVEEPSAALNQITYF
ncbi:MAG: thioredoxin domain-containing protein [Saprospiraceae bacterium]|nr:thioredoxin domain-containing protein [Saprospiraceae bacterium]